MKTRIFLITIITLMSLSSKSQSFKELNDTNVILYDYIPDTILYGSVSMHDSLRLDFNQDGILDFRFYYALYSGVLYPYVGSLNSNCKYTSYYDVPSNDSLNNPTINWLSGNNFWNTMGAYQDVLFGIKITSGTDSYFGWVHAIGGSAKAFTMTIDKYALCKIPNYPFHKGQTEISTGISQPDSTSITNIINSGTAIIIQSNKIIKQVKVSSSIGATVVIQNNVNSNSTSISTSGLAYGTYIVRVQFSDHTLYTTQVVL